jgi:hypothetical protein
MKTENIKANSKPGFSTEVSLRKLKYAKKELISNSHDPDQWSDA